MPWQDNFFFHANRFQTDNGNTRLLYYYKDVLECKISLNLIVVFLEPV